MHGSAGGARPLRTDRRAVWLPAGGAGSGSTGHGGRVVGAPGLGSEFSAAFGLVRQRVAFVIGPARAGRRGRSPPTPPAGSHTAGLCVPVDGRVTCAEFDWVHGVGRERVRNRAFATARWAACSCTQTCSRIGIAARARRGVARLLRYSRSGTGSRAHQATLCWMGAYDVGKMRRRAAE